MPTPVVAVTLKPVIVMYFLELTTKPLATPEIVTPDPAWNVIRRWMCRSS